MNTFQVIIAAYSVKNAQFSSMYVQATTTDIKNIFGFCRKILIRAGSENSSSHVCFCDGFSPRSCVR